MTSLLKKLFPKQVYLNLRTLKWYQNHYGIRQLIKNFGSLISFSDDIVSLKIPDIRTKFFLRPDTSDMDVFEQVFQEREYDIDLKNPSVIVDAGANIGLATLLFANRYEHAQVLSIEPETSNYHLLQRNVEYYENVQTIKGGLWSRKTHLKIENPDHLYWGFRVVESDNSSDIPAYSVQDIMDIMEVDQIDVLKIDIEGAEKEVFNHAEEWIDKVGFILIETHDRFKPGCTEALEKAVEGRGFKKSYLGENIILEKAP